MNTIHPFSLYAWLRYKLYKNGWRRQIRLNVPVISIGNIVFGGSGKTPMVMWFLQRFSSKYKIAVVSQSYAAKLELPKQVQVSEFMENLQTQIFGDEAVLIKKRFPNVDVWSGPIKSQTAKAAADNEKYDFIIVDDGFSHHQLYRDLDLVLLDVSRPLQHFRLPPFGQLRESCISLNRAHAIVFTKANAQSEKIVQSFKDLLSDWRGIWGNADYQSSLRGSSANSQTKYMLFSGVGNFEHVADSAKILLKQSIHKKIKFSNHFDYSKKDQKKIVQELKSSGSRGLTTEKDLVKIQNQELLKQTDVLLVEVKLDENTARWIDEKIRSLL